MKNTALITGASGGIGYELARIHASKKHDLILVARNLGKLQEMKVFLEKQYGIAVYTIGKDLSLPNAALEVYEEVNHHNLQVNFLINNAGFGTSGMFHETDWYKEYEMIQLNISALTQMTKIFLKPMVAQRSGKVLNVASTAAFQPGPTMAVYCATKAYVLSFSEAVNNEVSSMGVTITALCPGPTESGFQEAAGMAGSKLFSRNIPTSKQVAEYGYRAMMEGKAVAIHKTKNYLLANLSRFVPRSFVVNVARKVLDKSS